LPIPQYFTYDLVLGIWVALAVICGLYLLNLFRLGHDEPLEHVGVFRMLLGLSFLSLGIYLAPALFKSDKGENQRPGGVVYAWIDSFLLPEPGEEDMPWSANLKGTIDAARQELEKTGKPQYIFLDNTGVTCTNCKYNERNVFRGVIRKTMLDKYWLVQHYTDTVPAKFYVQDVDDDRRTDEAKKGNLEFQREQFRNEQLPLYVALEVKKDTVKIRGVYAEGKINDRTGFLKFLNDSQKTATP
jgi:thiol:disulfide interchange protein DsbD